MKRFFTLTVFLLTGLLVDAQNATAYQWYTINKPVGGKDIYLFTTPKAFTYPKGSTFAFPPVQYEKQAQAIIENKLKEFDPASNGLYINQITNGSRTSFMTYEGTKAEIEQAMQDLFTRLKQSSYRANDIEIVNIDFVTGNTLNTYSLPATKGGSNKTKTAGAY
jgi:hypothetical protein